MTTRNQRNQQRNETQNMPIAAGSSVLPATPASYLGPLTNLYQDMDRIFENTMRSFGLPGIFSQSSMQSFFNPKLDIYCTDEEYTIEVEAPGMSENDIRIDVTRNGELCICGEKRLENENQEKEFQQIERSYGSFSRTIQLPDDVDPEAIEARFENGILCITAPRMEQSASQSRRIEVRRGGNETSRKRERQENQRNEGSANQRSHEGASQQPKRAA